MCVIVINGDEGGSEVRSVRSVAELVEILQRIAVLVTIGWDGEVLGDNFGGYVRIVIAVAEGGVVRDEEGFVLNERFGTRGVLGVGDLGLIERNRVHGVYRTARAVRPAAGGSMGRRTADIRHPPSLWHSDSNRASCLRQPRPVADRTG